MPKPDLNFTNIEPGHAGLLDNIEYRDPFADFLAQSKDHFGTETCNFDADMFFGFDPSLSKAVLGEKLSLWDENSGSQLYLDDEEATLTMDLENMSNDIESSAETDR